MVCARVPYLSQIYVRACEVSQIRRGRSRLARWHRSCSASTRIGNLIYNWRTSPEWLAIMIMVGGGVEAGLARPHTGRFGGAWPLRCGGPLVFGGLAI